MTIWTYKMHVSCTYLWYSLALSYLLMYFELSNVATTHFLHFFFFLFMKITTKVPERSKNGLKKVPISSQRPKFCHCGAFLRKVPNSKSCFGARVVHIANQTDDQRTSLLFFYFSGARVSPSTLEPVGRSCWSWKGNWRHAALLIRWE